LSLPREDFGSGGVVSHRKLRLAGDAPALNADNVAWRDGSDRRQFVPFAGVQDVSALVH